MQATATEIVGVLAEAQETRQQWEALTQPTRQAALAADQELRRRYPEQALDPLQPAEPAGGTRQANDEAIRREDAAAVTGAISDSAWKGITERIATTRQNARVAQARLDELGGMRIPSEDGEAPDLGPAWTTLLRPDRDVIVQPARPRIVPASEVLRQAKERHAAAVPEAENA
jgi:hypothetical protein